MDAPVFTRMPVEALHPSLVEHRGHRHHALELRRTSEPGRSPPARRQVRAASRALAEIGSHPPKTTIVEVGERHEIADERVAALLAPAQADVGHLGERADRGGETLAHRDDTRIGGGGDGTHSGGEDAESAGGGSDLKRFGHAGRLLLRGRAVCSSACTCSSARGRPPGLGAPACRASSGSAPERDQRTSPLRAGQPPGPVSHAQVRARPSASAVRTSLSARNSAGNSPGDAVEGRSPARLRALGPFPLGARDPPPRTFPVRRAGRGAPSTCPGWPPRRRRGRTSRPRPREIAWNTIW